MKRLGGTMSCNGVHSCTRRVFMFALKCCACLQLVLHAALNRMDRNRLHGRYSRQQQLAMMPEVGLS